MKHLAKRDPHAVVTSVQQLPSKNMAVTHRVRPSAVLDVFRHTVPRSISFKGAVGFPSVLGELCRNHLS